MINKSLIFIFVLLSFNLRCFSCDDVCEYKNIYASYGSSLIQHYLDCIESDPKKTHVYINKINKICQNIKKEFGYENIKYYDNAFDCEFWWENISIMECSHE